MSYLSAFLVGGIICAIGQILIDKTKLTSARILVVYVVSGVILAAFGVYQKIIDIGGAGATIPLTGFGFNLAKGIFNEVDRIGILGIFTGGFKAASAGLSAAVFFGYIMAALGKPKAKK
ncbi:stage V sporulation protein AE [Ruminiclostridium sufflavum DSM 19573]|uniref:Stage V sporulation protein AE n=1 Tax=Ruminiclostridium sufflavum DSM 19573 TaxID=1121337 RepID=A0A318XH33_9FIRM|nr:stage V sporulation protein AE [Ruminiclostridium sufflavum]PYG85885.1 stage V sporulation protein AE [Ruminiclostridium sufflavum DSM 19573]